MTTKKIIMTLTLFAVLVTGISLVPAVQAHNAPAQGSTFDSSTQNVCYNISSLNSMKYEGSTSQGNTVAGQI